MLQLKIIFLRQRSLHKKALFKKIYTLKKEKMKFLKTLIVFAAFSVFNACTKDETSDPVNKIKISGVISKPELTFYQYGTHILTLADSAFTDSTFIDSTFTNSTFRDSTFFALKSDNINLDQYIGKKVTVSGNKIQGYPVDGGPEYINVTEIK